MPHTMYGAAENNRDSPYYFIINIEMPKRDASSPQNTVIFWLNPPHSSHIPLYISYIYLSSVDYTVQTFILTLQKKIVRWSI